MNTTVIKAKYTFVMLVVLWVIVDSCSFIPANKFAFSPTPQNGNVGGINAVYARENFESCGEYIHSYEVFRFYDDGTVLRVPLCLDGTVSDDWADLKQWFHRDSTNASILQGKYFTSHDQIWFSMTSQGITGDYLGTYSESKLILDLYVHQIGSHQESEKEYLKVNVEP